MNHGLKLTPKVLVELAEHYKAGKTTPELSKMYGISKATICRGLRKMGIEPERHDEYFKPTEVPQETIEAICKDFKTGILSVTDICHKHGVSRQVTDRILVEHGLLEKRPYIKSTLYKPPTKVIKVGDNSSKKILSEREQYDICEKYVEGPQTKVELAEEYAVHIDTISAILRRNCAQLKKYIPEDVVEQICVDFQSGLDVTDLAEIHNLSPDTIVHHLTKRRLFGTIDQGVTKPKPPTTPISAAAFRKLMQERSPRMLKVLDRILDDPTINPRTVLTAIQLMTERAYGRAKEEVEDENNKQTATAKILQLVSNNEGLFKKKAEGDKNE